MKIFVCQIVHQASTRKMTYALLAIAVVLSVLDPLIANVQFVRL